MNALVTGATGFVGRHLLEALLDRGDSVTALVRSPAKAAGLAERGVHLVRGDLDDADALASAARDQEVVYHVAGLVAARSDAEFLRVNRDGTGRLMAAVQQAGGARIVLVSSLAAGGPVARGTLLRDERAAAPVTAYGRSKLAGEQVLRAGPLPWTILRPPAVYGPHDTEMLRLFKAVRWGLAPVFGDGSQELSLIFGPDLGRALAAAGHSEAATGRVFYPCHPEIVTSAALVRTVASVMGHSLRLIPLPRLIAEGALRVTGAVASLTGRATLLTPDKANEFFADAWTCDSEPLTSMTGWKAGFDLAAGAAATAAWYRAAGLL